MIQNRDIQESTGFLDLLGNLQVSLGGLQIAGWMVVCQDNSRSVGFNGDLVDHPDIGNSPAETALGDLMITQDLVRAVQANDVEVLHMLKAREHLPEKPVGIL